MTWSTIMKCLSYKRPRICSKSHRPFLVFSSLMTYHGVCNLCNTTSAGTAYLSGASKLAHVMYLLFMLSITYFPVLSFVLWCTLRFLCKNHVRFVFNFCCSCFFNGICILFTDTSVQHDFHFRWCFLLKSYSIFGPLSTLSLFLVSPPCLSMSLSTCAPVHSTILQLYSSLLAEEARVPGSAVNIRYSLLCQNIHVHRAISRNWATKFTVFTYRLHTRKIKANQYVRYVVSLEIQ